MKTMRRYATRLALGAAALAYVVVTAAPVHMF